MTKKTVELLAPAGNYDSFIGAINAGADAVYVGGDKFSARAFAENFDTQTLCDCIRYAHLFGRKVYLTLNTLIKESEFGDIYDYVLPFYMAGLDGVIIQDLGVLRFLKAHFPHMELHASTQMAVTGPEFVKLCQELGISRVVPARELSLQELQAISDAGIEVECFIHGAMCYCFSGMCLMSSILGGRSGNRGKCAQPCRLPYNVSLDGGAAKDTYTLSLKDMCTIEHIPELIEAGMASFKIEGRMKRSEYAAGVTALYRKYMDAYYKNPEKPLQISRQDRHILERLYMRSELHNGYLYKHNGKEMVTRDAPSYNGLEDSILEDISQKYLGYTLKIPVSMYGYFAVGQEASLTVFTEDGLSVTVSGQQVSAAAKAPVTTESVSKQLSKLGNTHFSLAELDVMIEGEAFLPNGMLNALRREALEQLEQKIIDTGFPEAALRKAVAPGEDMSSREDDCTTGKKLSVLINNRQQLEVLRGHSICDVVDTVYLEDEAMDCYLEEKKAFDKHIRIVYAMPYILRGRDLEAQRAYIKHLANSGVSHILVRNVEELALISSLQRECQLTIYSDASLYCWNRSAVQALGQYAERITLPYELNTKEMRPLRSNKTEQIIYGYIPLMVTANCIYKTNGSCQLSSAKTEHRAFLKDRYNKVFTAVTNCKYCYNVIYNSVPLSLHKKYNKAVPGTARLQFSIEDGAAMKRILNYYETWVQDKAGTFPVEEYTTAHENRQVE